MMLTPCGPRAVPTGGAGVAEAAFRATLTSAATFFLAGMRDGFLVGGWVRPSDLLDLREGEVDRSLPAQDLDQRLEPLVVDVDLGDRRMHAGERAVDHHHRVTDGEVGDLDLLLGAPARALARGGG